MIPIRKCKDLKVAIKDTNASGMDFIVYWFGSQQVEKKTLDNPTDS